MTTCEICSKEIIGNGFLTGYGVNEAGDKICYECCGVLDRQDMIATGKAVLYLTVTKKNNFFKGYVSNWPGTLKINVQGKIGRHNIAGIRYDCWFRFNGRNWHGVTYGDNTQLCHCKQLKD